MDTRYGNSFTDFSRDLLLRDGAMLRFRTLRLDDRGALKDLLSRCSPDSIRYRFLHSIRALPEKTFDQVAHVDCPRVVTLVVVHGAGADERIIAVGRYHALEDRPDVAEVSFLVEDAMQRRGIGTLLLDDPLRNLTQCCSIAAGYPQQNVRFFNGPRIALRFGV
jgi:hypothetical protein